ncbi:hypothetical protein BOX15_Mlig002156g2 [Macrostomum lignano]|uniref:Uncharacterized protein n=2 Tax=Macrostomum lignano TaxID=282301 RepID=A0A267E6G5_9PLAT|nr:hypothetical protein BOX15_Mlig002156g2 [Macrostomum lignano]
MTANGAPSSSHKRGHRRVSSDGNVTFKRRSTSEIMTAIQLGIEYTVSRENHTPMRDLLTHDFCVVESFDFPSDGGRGTPAHKLSSFAFKCYAPAAFRQFRRFYGINMAQFLHSICASSLLELPNAGASGSIFFRTADDCFIIKTVQRGEAKYLRRLLQQYYITLTQNPGTLLPKFYGLYCYKCGSKRIRFAVMNNLLPSRVPICEKFDLKGSTYKRRASPEEKAKACPTLKDLDFREIHPSGLLLEAEAYDQLVDTLARDCLVLRSFSIMDYSLLVAVCNLDCPDAVCGDSEVKPTHQLIPTPQPDAIAPHPPSTEQQRWYPASATAPPADPELESAIKRSPISGLPAWNERGDRLLLYVGIVDILQDYRLAKRMEHTMWSLVTDAESVSVVHPDFYSTRYQSFLREFVFKRSVD